MKNQTFGTTLSHALQLAALMIAGVIGVAAQAADPLAELEAWNKIKESTAAADYHAFLQKFPSGSLAARAREKMNSLGDPVWNELKKSNDPFKYRDYIKANPNSPFLDQAKARLEVLTVAAMEWEKLKAESDLNGFIGFIRSNPSHPFLPDAKKHIEKDLTAAATSSESEEILQFIKAEMPGTEHGKIAGDRLAALKAARLERGFSELDSYFRGHTNISKWPWNATQAVFFQFDLNRSDCSLAAGYSVRENGYTTRREYRITPDRFSDVDVSLYLNMHHVYVYTPKRDSIRALISSEHKGKVTAAMPESAADQGVWLNVFPDRATADEFASNYRKLVQLCREAR